jgi:hypothetical protein
MAQPVLVTAGIFPADVGNDPRIAALLHQGERTQT